MQRRQEAFRYMGCAAREPLGTECFPPWNRRPFFSSKTLKSVFCTLKSESPINWPNDTSHRLNVELDLQSLFGLLCTAVPIGWYPATPPVPPHLGSYTRALFVHQDLRHLFVTPWYQYLTLFSSWTIPLMHTLHFNTLPHFPPLRFHCVILCWCWDQTKECCVVCIYCTATSATAHSVRF